MKKLCNPIFLPYQLFACRNQSLSLFYNHQQACLHYALWRFQRGLLLLKQYSWNFSQQSKLLLRKKSWLCHFCITLIVAYEFRLCLQPVGKVAPCPVVTPPRSGFGSALSIFITFQHNMVIYARTKIDVGNIRKQVSGNGV